MTVELACEGITANAVVSDYVVLFARPLSPTTTAQARSGKRTTQQLRQSLQRTEQFFVTQR
jgi:hypothetical protein